MGEGQELRNDALCNETPQEKLKENCTCQSHVLRIGVHLPGCPLYKVPTHLPEQAPSKPDVDTPRTTNEFIIALGAVELGIIDSTGIPRGLAANLPTIRDAIRSQIGRTDSVGSDDFKEDCFALRAQIEETKKQTMLVIREHPVFLCEQSTLGPDQRGEMIANLKLAYRHLEDARMRYGKAIQAFDGGKSCYPR